MKENRGGEKAEDVLLEKIILKRYGCILINVLKLILMAWHEINVTSLVRE